MKLEKVFDLRAGNLRGEAAPIHVEGVVAGGQEIVFVADAGFGEGFVECDGLVGTHDAVAGAEEHDGGRRFRPDVVERREQPVAVGKFLRRAADVLFHRGLY